MILNKLSENPNLSDFSCGELSIDNKVKNMYFPHILKQGTAFEIILSDNGNTNITVGYIFITFITIRFEDCDYQSNLMHEYFPAAYIDFIAIDKPFQGNKLGSTALDLLIKIFKSSEQYVDFRYIVIDSLTNRTSFYEKLGFKYFFINGNSKQQFTVSMYYDLIKDSEITKIENYSASLL